MKNKAAAKRFWPLILVAVLWLAILITPALNRLFRAQLFGSEVTSFSVLPAPTDVPNFWEKSARRFPQDVSILMQAAKEYPVLEESEEGEYSAYEEALMPSTPNPRIGSTNSTPTPMIDPSLPQSQVFPGKMKGNHDAEKLRRLDLLIARFPSNATLIALRLHTTFFWLKNGRVGGELSDGNLENNQAAGKPSPERSLEKPNFTAADLQKGVELARRGSQLEPDNAFFDWAKCFLLMYAWRDEEAFQALDVAAKKQNFDDHSLPELEAKNAALETVFGRELILEEKTQNLFYSFSQSARYREMARIISWQATKAQRRGDHQQALRIASGLARVAARMRESSRVYMEGLQASAIESIAWVGPTYQRRKRSQRSQPRLSVSTFQAYAKKHGRPELAAEAERNYAAKMKFRAIDPLKIATPFNQIPIWVFILISFSWMLGVLLLLLLPMAFLGAVLMNILGLVPRARGVLRVAETSNLEIPSAREVWNGALACGGFRAVITAISGALVAGLCVASIMIGLGESAEVFGVIDEIRIGIKQISSPSNGLYYGQSLLGNLTLQSRIVVALLPLLLGVLFAAWRATEWQKARNGESSFDWRTFAGSIFQGRVFQSPTAEDDGFDFNGALRKLADWFLMLLLIAALATLALENNTGGSYFMWMIPFALACLFAGILLIEKISIWRKRPGRLSSLRFGLRLLQRSLFAWLVLGSVLYFILLLISLPLRHRVETQIDRVLRLGEVGAAKSN